MNALLTQFRLEMQFDRHFRKEVYKAAVCAVGLIVAFTLLMIDGLSGGFLIADLLQGLLA